MRVYVLNLWEKITSVFCHLKNIFESVVYFVVMGLGIVKCLHFVEHLLWNIKSPLYLIKLQQIEQLSQCCQL